MNAIVRLRGDAPGIVWPESVIRPAIDRCHTLRDQEPKYPDDADSATRRTVDRLRRDWQLTFSAACARCAFIFADANGWKRADYFSPARLIGERGLIPLWAIENADHPDYLVKPGGGAPVAIIGHNYSQRVNLAVVPESIVVDSLPSSWYSRNTAAFVLRRGLPPITRTPRRKVRVA